MNIKFLKVVPSLAMAMALLVTVGCGLTTGSVSIGPLQSESQSVELEGVEPVRVEIEMGAGELNVAGGADELMEAEFTYNVAALKPEVVLSGRKLTIQQPEVDIASLADIPDYRYEWDLRFNDGVPLDLKVDLGAGAMDLDLVSLSLTALEIDIGTGEGTLDLTGDWTSDLDVNIISGVSSITVRLPSDIGVRVEIDGISRINASDLTKEGDIYVNDAYGESDVTLYIHIEGGLGEINLELGE